MHVYIYKYSNLCINNHTLILFCNVFSLNYIVEQTSGLTTDGKNRILDIQPRELHQRCGYYVGSKQMVEMAMSLLKETEKIEC